jgi:hypothetical protein
MGMTDELERVLSSLRGPSYRAGSVRPAEVLAMLLDLEAEGDATRADLLRAAIVESFAREGTELSAGERRRWELLSLLGEVPMPAALRVDIAASELAALPAGATAEGIRFRTLDREAARALAAVFRERAPIRLSSVADALDPRDESEGTRRPRPWLWAWLAALTATLGWMAWTYVSPEVERDGPRRLMSRARKSADRGATRAEAMGRKDLSLAVTKVLDVEDCAERARQTGIVRRELDLLGPSEHARLQDLVDALDLGAEACRP